ncbi:Melanoma-associated antigen G1 [Ooceraea biroi]|uniref:Melanoma-associated antigen G1 n=1 Tax=Ooceraea biroi TaxID=2015173 RepID=A0A026VSU8_OOCBI|nr:Melanoma-associated antigen G1 [Ooceraea biroi]
MKYEATHVSYHLTFSPDLLFFVISRATKILRHVKRESAVPSSFTIAFPSNFCDIPTRMSKRKWASQGARGRESSVSLSQDCPGPSSQLVVSSSQRNTRSSAFRESLQLSSSQSTILQNMDTQEEMQLVSCVIRYLLVADRNKLPIQKNQIIKNALNGNGKQLQLILDTVRKHLLEVFGYKLMEIESNRYILINDVANHLPHLTFESTAGAQVLLFLVLVHIFMLGESCKEEALWDFLRKLNIIRFENVFLHEYFGDIKQLVTVDFVNQRYLEKIVNKDDTSQVEYAWGRRAKNEITYRSALEFVAEIYDQSSLNNWKLQYKAVIAQEQGKQS